MNIGFIGVGKIASAVIEGLCTSSLPDVRLYLSPRNEKNSRALAGKYAQAERMNSNQEVLDRSDVVFVALRPTVTVDILRELRFDKRHVVISVIALVAYDELLAAVKPAVKVSRAIPLPPVAQHNCPIPVFQPQEGVEALLGHLGHVLPVVTEKELHAIWVLSGLISPFYEQLQALSDWTVSEGVDRTTANAYIADMYQSLAFIAQRSNPIDFRELAWHAATPGGMNEQAGKELREKGLQEAYVEVSGRLLKRYPVR